MYYLYKTLPVPWLIPGVFDPLPIVEIMMVRDLLLGILHRFLVHPHQIITEPLPSPWWTTVCEYSVACSYSMELLLRTTVFPVDVTSVADKNSGAFARRRVVSLLFTYQC